MEGYKHSDELSEWTKEFRLKVTKVWSVEYGVLARDPPAEQRRDVMQKIREFMANRFKITVEELSDIVERPTADLLVQ